jgi:hypothetical protein
VRFDLRANVHGLDVYADNGNVRFLMAEGTLTGLMDVERFLGLIATGIEQLPVELPNSGQAILLLNAALINPEPLAQLVLAISAVEMLGQTGEWSQPQRELLQRLAAAAETDQGLPVAERMEVAGAVRRNLFRIGLRQGVLRVLGRLNLSHLKAAWDDVYGQRSAIFHGTLRLTPPEEAQLANKAVMLCCRIDTLLAVPVYN